MIRILTITTLYPNAEAPTHGIFVENRLRHLVDSDDVAARVVAPVPWFPSGARVFGTYGAHARVPAAEERNGLSVLHPRYPVIPKFGMSLAPYLMSASLRPVLRRLLSERPGCDLIDAHYFYPDGVAAVMLGRRLNVPVVITARGTDLNVLPTFQLPRRMILWAARHADGLITVSKALRDRLVALGVPTFRP